MGYRVHRGRYGGRIVRRVIPPGVRRQVYVTDTTTRHNYTLYEEHRSGNIATPDTLGTAVPGAKPVATIPEKDGYQLVDVGFDYPAFEAAPPASTTLTPTIVGGIVSRTSPYRNRSLSTDTGRVRP